MQSVQSLRSISIIFLQKHSNLKEKKQASHITPPRLLLKRIYRRLFVISLHCRCPLYLGTPPDLLDFSSEHDFKIRAEKKRVLVSIYLDFLEQCFAVNLLLQGTNVERCFD